MNEPRGPVTIDEQLRILADAVKNLTVPQRLSFSDLMTLMRKRVGELK
jgi:hypothetical protein